MDRRLVMEVLYGMTVLPERCSGDFPIRDEIA